MSKNLSELPFTEIVERAVQITRLEGDDSRVRGAINDQYVREIPRKEDWSFLIVSSAITCTEDYTTGNAAVVNTQGSTFTLSSDTAIDATFVGRKVKFATNPNVYDIVTVVGTTGGTINPPLSGTQNVRSASYFIAQPIYALTKEFDRFPKNGGLLLYEGGRMTVIPEVPIQEYFRDYIPTPGKPAKCRLVNAGTDLLQRIELQPPPSEPFVLGYECLQKLDPLRETTAGFVTIDAGSTSVVGSAGTTRFTEAQTGWYFRIDAFGTGDDSEWYRINAIAHNSACTLAVAFGLSGAGTSTYTISPVPKYPLKLQPAVLYGAVVTLLADQNDPTSQLYAGKYSETLSDCRRLYKTRVYSQPIDTVLEDWDYRR